LLIAGGSFGCQVALDLVRLLRDRVLQVLARGHEVDADAVDACLRRLVRVVFLDSAPAHKIEMAVQDSADPQRVVTLRPPASYRPLASWSGDRIEELLSGPLGFLRPYLERASAYEELQHKAQNSEASGNRMYGLLNFLVEIEYRLREIRDGFEFVRTAPSSDEINAFCGLTNGRIEVDLSRVQLVVLGGLGGGQLSGLAVPLVASASEVASSHRCSTDIVLHFVLPPYAPALSVDEEARREIRALAVLRDLYRMKEGVAPFVPHPNYEHDGLPLHRSSLKGAWDHLVLHPGRHVADAVRFQPEAVVNAVARRVLGEILGPFGADIATFRSNGYEDARQALVQNITPSLRKVAS
jgi:hypothetical protein